jgi:hypothetical protein
MWVMPLVLWTVLVWVSRIRNVLGDEDLDGFGTTWRLGAAIIFIALGLACGSWLLRGKPGGVALMVLAVWSVCYWLVRGIGILLDSNHDASFKVVHTVLMLVTFALVGAAVLGLRRATVETGRR